MAPIAYETIDFLCTLGKPGVWKFKDSAEWRE